ncbi:MAG TPA: 16S rRNA (uracil(1498)-N(3))-methyltransferase [Deltaproteobacteria bacterium]|nr:16S rRNA (uracil(1498)-N(3))-methyltransferase [Deltaproteobacteria bacterium]
MKKIFNIIAGVGMRRFFIEQLSDKEKMVLITGKELHHLKDVLRLKKGNDVIVFDGKGLEFAGIIETVSKNEARIIIEKKLNISRESQFEIILCQGLAKGEKTDLILQKTTELGASKIIPFVTSRVVTKLKGEQIAKKTQRWQYIALEAAKQCKRSIIPKIEKPTTFAEILSRWPADNKRYLKIIPWEGEKGNNLKDILKSDKFSGCVALIGPEGGFSEVEVVEAKKAGFIPVMLGPRILRTETASISVVAIIQYELGDMGRLEKP